MRFWKDIKRSRAERLVREADSYLGDFHKKLHHTPEDAVAKCRKAIRLNPDYAEAYLVLANALNKEGTRDDAITGYRKAIEIDPGLYWGHINLAKVLQLKADHATAANMLEESRNLLEEAVILFKSAFAIKEGNRQHRTALAKVLDALGKQDEAITEYKDILKDYPDNSSLLYGLGSSQYNKKLYNEALATYRRLIEKSPENKANHVHVGRTLAALGRQDEALEEYRKAEFHIRAGELLQENDRYDEALKEFKESIQKDQSNKDWAYYHIGIFLWEKEKKPEALKHLRTFLKLVDQMRDYPFPPVMKDRQEAYDQVKRIVKDLEK